MPKPWTNQDIVLYHGTTLPQAGNIMEGGVQLSFGRPAADFGRGFYTTTNLRQAVRHGERRAKYRGEHAAVVELMLARESLAKLDGLAFVLGDALALDFWSLVDFCRGNGTGHGRKAAGFYDVVYGPVTKNWNQRTLHSEFDQVSFHTERAVLLLNQPGRRKIL